jgi:hypothetical protein
LEYIFTSCLFEKRHGTHHEAQKSSKNTFPFIDDNRIESPFRSGKEKSSLESVIFGCTCAFAEIAIVRKQASTKFFKFIILWDGISELK